jgi:hypothetical protein
VTNLLGFSYFWEKEQHDQGKIVMKVHRTLSNYLLSTFLRAINYAMPIVGGGPSKKLLSVLHAHEIPNPGLVNGACIDRH